VGDGRVCKDDILAFSVSSIAERVCSVFLKFLDRSPHFPTIQKVLSLDKLQMGDTVRKDVHHIDTIHSKAKVAFSPWDELIAHLSHFVGISFSSEKVSRCGLDEEL
jgi:hypothetical protein